MTYLNGKVVDDSEPLRAELARQSGELEAWKRKHEALVGPVRARLQAEVDRRNEAASTTDQTPVDLKPLGRWDFENDGRDSVGNMHGTLRGNAKVEGGALVLNGGYMLTTPLPQDLTEKSLEVLVQLDSLEQRAGGAMTVQTLNGTLFDSIVFAEMDAGLWLAGSNNFARTESFGGPVEQDASTRAVRIVIVYHADGRIIGYRDGKQYGHTCQKGALNRFRSRQAQVVLGLRHGTGPKGGRMLGGRIYVH